MITPDEFMQQAMELTDPQANPSEVDFRTAVSRAYYCLYHQALTMVRNHHKSELVSAIQSQLDRRRAYYTISKVKSLDWDYLVNILHVGFHQVIYKVLSGLDYQTGQLFGAHQDERNIADYELDKNLDPQDCRTMIGDMQTLITSLSSI